MKYFDEYSCFGTFFKSIGGGGGGVGGFLDAPNPVLT